MGRAFLKRALLVSVASGAAATATAVAQDETDIDDNEDVIVVRGLRASLQEAKDLKRASDAVVDVISAADIGNFVDDNLTDAVQRIPGVQVERDEAGTDGDRISIRGLGPQFVTNTVNGRTVLSSGTEGLGNLRSVNIGAFPAEIVAGVEVQKTPLASSPEFGLAGSVDVKTLRPLDAPALRSENTFANLTLRAEQSGVDADGGFRISGATGWVNEEKTFGAYISAVYGETDRLIDQVNYQSRDVTLRLDDDNDGVQDRTQTVFAPTAFVNRPIEDDITRVAFSGGAQWRPSEDLTFTLDATYTSIDSDSFRDTFLVLSTRTYNRPIRSEDVTIDENNTLQSLDLTNVGLSPLLRSQPQRFDNQTDNLIVGLKTDYQVGNTTHTFDLYHSSVDYEQDLRFSIFQNVNFDTTGIQLEGAPRDVPRVTGLGSLATSPDGYRAVFGVGRGVDLQGDQFGAAYDFAYELTEGFFNTLEAGFRYTSTDLDSRRTAAQRFTNAAGNDPGEIATASALDDLYENFGRNIDGFEPSSWWRASLEAAAEFQPGLLTTAADDLETDPLASFQVEENILAVYAQTRFETLLGDLPIDGNVGVRAVQTDLTTNGSAIGDGFTEPTPVEFSSDDWEILPNLNVRIRPTDKSAIRLAAGRTLSRANYDELSPLINVGPLQTDPDDPDATPLRTARSGNPELKAMTSWNYDATFEFYPNPDGAIVASIFYKDVENFIVSQTVESTIQGFGDEVFRVIQPVNFSSGNATGFEIGFVQDFSFLPAPFNGFGAQANYTYVDSEFDDDVGDAGFGFPGSSENNYNAQVYYENGPVTLRAAYTYRDDYFRLLAGTGAQNDNARFTEGFGTLDLTGRVRVNDNLMFIVQGLNVTEEVRRDFIGVESNFLDYFDRGRTVIFSLRGRL